MAQIIESIIPIKPKDLIRQGQQILATTFTTNSEKEPTQDDIMRLCCAHNLGTYMEIAGNAILNGKLSSLLSMCDEKLQDPLVGFSQQVLKPSYEYIISTSDDQSLKDRALFGLATLHLKGHLFESISIEERYRLPTEQTVAIADQLIEFVVNDKLYDKWTDQVRDPYVARRRRRGC